MIKEINFKLEQSSCGSTVRGPFHSLRSLKRTKFGTREVDIDDRRN